MKILFKVCINYIYFKIMKWNSKENADSKWKKYGFREIRKSFVFF